MSATLKYSKRMINTENSSYGIEWYLERVEYMSAFMMPERIEGLKRVLSERTRYMTICMENTFHPQNASALVRHCDAFGLQDIHTIETLCKFKPNVNIVKGTDKWIHFHRHRTTADALTALKTEGYRIVATTPHEGGDTTPELFDVTRGKFALVFGTEHEGISQQVIDAADEFIRIPMWGFVESLNVSASAAILIYMLSQKVRAQTEGWELPEESQARILFEWVMKSVKDSQRILGKKFPEV